MQLLSAHRVPLVEDDVYAELCVAASAPAPSALGCAGEPAVRLVFQMPGAGLSGRLGGGRGHAERIQRLQLISTLSTNVPSQLALADMLRQGERGRPLSPPAPYPGPAPAADAGLPAAPLPEARISAPAGGYFLWLGLDHRLDSRACHTGARSAAPGARGALLEPGPAQPLPAPQQSPSLEPGAGGGSCPAGGADPPAASAPDQG